DLVRDGEDEVRKRGHQAVEEVAHRLLALVGLLEPHVHPDDLVVVEVEDPLDVVRVPELEHVGDCLEVAFLRLGQRVRRHRWRRYQGWLSERSQRSGRFGGSMLTRMRITTVAPKYW